MRAAKAKQLLERSAKKLFRETCWAFMRAAKFPPLRQKRTPEERLARQREHYRGHRAKLLAAGEKPKRRRLTPEQNRERKRRWQEKNPEKHRAYRQRVERERALSPAYVLNRRVRDRIREKLGRIGVGVDSLLGYSMDELRAHLERQFLKGMGWHNRRLWHIDHIVPLASFEIKAVGDDAFRAAWALSNLRPLWAKDNEAKKDRRTHLL